MLGNQQGKTLACANEMAMHACNLYPEWHKGRQFSIPPKIERPESFIGWYCSVTSQAVRDNAQKKLLGDIGQKEGLGSGAIPLDHIESFTMSRGISDFVDTIRVRREDGGFAILQSRTYEQSVLSYQGVPVDISWVDEDMGYDDRIYSELLARRISTNGQIISSLTPMLGTTPLRKRFIAGGPGIFQVRGGIEQALHIPAERRQEIIDSIPEHQRGARIWGLEMQGEGIVFQTPVPALYHDLRYDSTAPHWRWGWGFDFDHGGRSSQAHPFAAVLGCHDIDNDVLYLFEALRLYAMLPHQHVARIKENPCWDAPVLWPHDGNQSGDASSGETISTMYRKLGLNLRPEHTTFREGGYSFEAGIKEMDDRMATGRLRVAKHLQDWFTEYSNYHYDGGKVVKEDDDLMSATRVLCMGTRHMRALNADRMQSPDGYRNHRSPWATQGETMCKGLDFDLFTGR